MRVNHKQKIILILVSVFMLLLNIMTSASVYSREKNLKAERAANVTRAYAMEVKRDLSYGTDCTEYMKKLLKSGGGSAESFDYNADLIIKNSVEYMALFQNGTVYNSYTDSGDQKKLDGLMKISQVSSAAEYAAETRKLVLYGPFDFPEIGRRVAVIDPVFLKNSAGEDFLWGYAVVVMRVPDVYKQSLKELRSLRYDYCLDASISPYSSKQIKIEAGMENKTILDEPAGYSFNIGQCRWTLNVEPREGWGSVQALEIFLGGILLNIVFVIMVYSLFRLRSQERNMRKMAYVDALTGILNRGGFMDRLDQCIDGSDIAVTAVFIDINDFKIINDVYGHMAGDQVLINLANHLKEVFTEGSVIGRTGGDEFCVLVQGMEKETLRNKINKLVKEHRYISADNQTVYYSISAGYADYPAQAHDRKQLLIMADEALYAAKTEGKNEARYFEDSMRAIKREHMGFSAKTIASRIPGAVLIYQAGGNEQIFFANYDLVHLFGCKDMDDFLQYTRSSFRNIVHPDDLERVEKEIQQQISIQINDPEYSKDFFDDYVEYRIITKDGKTVPVIDLGRLVHDDHYGEVFFVFIFPEERIRKKSCDITPDVKISNEDDLL